MSIDINFFVYFNKMPYSFLLITHNFILLIEDFGGIIILQKKERGFTMQFINKNDDFMKCHCKCTKLSTLLIGMLAGSALTAVAFGFNKLKCKGKSLKKLMEDKCHCFEDDGDSICECEPCDHERARNNCTCHAEESDTDILHSHGCLGNPHDDFEGFADSKGDRPSDLSSPELEDKGECSPYEVKNSTPKQDPKPENKINEVKKK